MASAAPSTRRPRSSVGIVDNVFNEGPSQPQPNVDVEFRRKHSRQNKEIIAENVRHKTAMKVLNLEIGSLQEELMEVKQINRILSLQMKKVKEDQARVNTTSAIQAVDALIAAMPALQALRQSMVPTAAALPVFEGEVARRNMLRNIGMTIATRPAVAGGTSNRLGTLGEEEEEEVEEDTRAIPSTSRAPRSVTTLKVMADPPIALTTPISRNSAKTVVAARRPTPNHNPSDLLGASTQRSTASPMSQTMPRSPIPHGLRANTSIAPPSFVVNSPASSASSSPIRRTTASPRRKARRRRESGLVPPVPPISQVHDDQDANIDSSSVHTATCSSQAGSSQEPSLESSLSSAPSLDESTRSTSSSAVSSTLTGLSDLSLAEGVSMSLDDDGKRGRRSRMSVNYKEPSLTKKMRKPDGIAVADMLARRQILHDSLSSSTRPPSGMRRKSVLPSSATPQSGTSTNGDSEDEDVDDIDDCLGALDQAPEPSGSTHTSTMSEPPSSPLSSLEDDISVGRGPNPTQRSKDTQPCSTPETEHPTHPPLRTSPRKTTGSLAPARLKPRRSALATPKPAERAPARGSRNALADVPEPNYEPKSITALLAARKEALKTKSAGVNGHRL